MYKTGEISFPSGFSSPPSSSPSIDLSASFNHGEREDAKSTFPLSLFLCFLLREYLFLSLSLSSHLFSLIFVWIESVSKSPLFCYVEAVIICSIGDWVQVLIKEVTFSPVLWPCPCKSIMVLVWLLKYFLWVKVLWCFSLVLCFCGCWPQLAWKACVKSGSGKMMDGPGPQFMNLDQELLA